MGKGVLITLLVMLLLSVSTHMWSDPAFASPSIRVLHVSAFCYNETREIINIAGASSLFEVTQIGILDFNNGNPSNLFDYDVMVFGLSNRFEGPDAYYAPYAGTIGRISELKNYVNAGGGIVWTHDSLTTGNDYGANAEDPAGVDYTISGTSVGSAAAKIVDEHQVMHYPFEIGDVGDTRSILATHTWYTAVTTAAVVMMFEGQPADPNNFYLAVHEYGDGRVAVIQLGCLTLVEYDGTFGSWPSVLESRIFVNSLCWASGAQAPLAASISPLSASMHVFQSVIFTSAVSGGSTPYNYQWHLDGAPVSGATSASWTFAPTASGTYYVYLRVTDAEANTSQSDAAIITVAGASVGGYSISMQVQGKAEPIVPYIALVVALTAILNLRRRIKRKR